MALRTKRWNDPVEADDGYRLLICRFRPRALPKSEETWHGWQSDLGPSKQLLADFHGKGRLQTGWTEYRARYLTEMLKQKTAIHDLAKRIATGETITLLCSADCVRENRCHRSLLRTLIEAESHKINGV